VTTKEIAKEIRKKLKVLGFKRGQISVTAPNVYSVRVTLKDRSINIDPIEKMCKQFESYRRDQATGEILQGGNTFVFVQY